MTWISNLSARLLAGLPETFADHPDADPDQIAAAAEWVSL